MKNIFEGAKFGDKFLTKGGDVIIFQRIVEQWATCISKDKLIIYYDCNTNNPSTYDHNDDIVSRYQEHIDEEKLDELAKNNIPRVYEEDDEWNIPYIVGFKVGYKKAMEE